MLRPGWTDVVLRATLLVLVASALAACGSLGGASHPSRASVSPEPPSPEIQARYAGLVERLQAGDANAVAELAAFSAENPGLAGPLLNLGLARVRAGDEAGARALFERASTVCTHCGAVWNELGILDRLQGQFAEAEKAYRLAIELEPGYASSYYNLAVLYELYIPRPELAVENYERYLQLGGTAGEGQDVEKWVADLRRRSGVPAAARAEATS